MHALHSRSCMPVACSSVRPLKQTVVNAGGDENASPPQSARDAEPRIATMLSTLISTHLRHAPEGPACDGAASESAASSSQQRTSLAGAAESEPSSSACFGPQFASPRRRRLVPTPFRRLPGSCDASLAEKRGRGGDEGGGAAKRQRSHGQAAVVAASPLMAVARTAQREVRTDAVACGVRRRPSSNALGF